MPCENNNNEQFNKTNGALIRDITPPDLVAEIMDIIASGSDKTQITKKISKSKKMFHT